MGGRAVKTPSSCGLISGEGGDSAQLALDAGERGRGEDLGMQRMGWSSGDA